MDPPSSNQCCSKVNCISQFCNHVLIICSLNYSGIKMTEVTQPCKILLILATRRIHVLPLSFIIIRQNISFFFSQPKCVMESWLHLNHSNSTNSPRNFFSILWGKNHPMIFAAIMTLKLHVLVFCFCVLSHLINGKIFDGRARVTQVCILYTEVAGDGKVPALLGKWCI